MPKDMKMFFKRKASPADWLIVFLGNPGMKYVNTRHNVGFMCADVLESQLGVKISRLRFRALTTTVKLSNSTVFLMKPQTYMNLSGEAVAPACSFYKTPPERILVVCDDTSLPLGKLRIREKGSSGGHNGLKNIALHLGTEGFPRLKIGVGEKPHPDYDMADWVLSSFKNQEAADIDIAVKKAAEAIEYIVKEGTYSAMSKFN
ncbi:aminoacyl-tRNA hydrolase [Clostridiaceae bacterium OttesenSCG-928-D20]|nr:aminoacyl-tRNA hydrolase [Clostridiaceae bacterium OttesenSCG-928-D20]